MANIPGSGFLARVRADHAQAQKIDRLTRAPGGYQEIARIVRKGPIGRQTLGAVIDALGEAQYSRPEIVAGLLENNRLSNGTIRLITRMSSSPSRSR